MAKPISLFTSNPESCLLHNPYGPINTGGVPIFNKGIELLDSGNGEVRAVVSGFLRTYPPNSIPPNLTIPSPAPVPISPDRPIALWLHPSPTLMINPSISPIFNQMRFTLIGLRYANLDYNSIKDSIINNPDINFSTQTQYLEGLSNDEKFLYFLNGEISIWITQGMIIGQGKLEDDMRKIAFQVSGNLGFYDPSYFYQWMLNSNLVDDNSKVNTYLTEFPPTWGELINNLQKFVDDSKTLLFPYSVLQDLRNHHNLSNTSTEWVEIRSNQKELFRKRLLKRVDRLPAGEVFPAFEYDSDDWQNLFQLESIVEFYMNFNDPWKSAPLSEGENIPRSPLRAGGTPNPTYESVDLSQGLHFVIIDSFGPRIEGSNGTVVIGNQFSVDNDVSLARVVENFDTIFIEGASDKKVFRITNRDINTSMLTLDSNPNLVGQSNWYIPSGIGGGHDNPGLNLDVFPIAGLDNRPDHYDGRLFIIFEGIIHNRGHSWSSYTSRHPAFGHGSIRGNKQYSFVSARAAGHDNINYAFHVREWAAPTNIPPFNDVHAFGRGNGWGFNPPAPSMKGRNYFVTPATNDPKNQIFLHYGRTRSRGDGNDYSGSEGCLVSPAFYQLRNTIIEMRRRYIGNNNWGNTLYNIGKNQSESVYNNNLYQAGNCHDNINTDTWDCAIMGSLWLIRPDEKSER